MPWFLYNGARPKPIPTGDGKVVAVRPQNKIEIIRVTDAAQRLINSGELIRTSGKKEAQVERVVPKPMEVKKSQFGEWIAEKGATLAKGLPPKRGDGKVEMTAGEIEASKVVVAGESQAAGEGQAPAEADKDKAKKDKKNKQDRGW